jgi:N-acetylmuramoyl-L-alanine amidase-like protein
VGRTGGARRVLLLVALALTPQPLSASADPGLLETKTALRRVCLPMGVPALESEPSDAAPDVRRAPRIGGGTYVRLTGRRAHGFVEVRVLRGELKWVPETDAESSRPSLCLPQATIVRACGEPTEADGVPVFDDPAAAVFRFHIPSGSRVQAWGYFPDAGRWTLVERDGQIGFARSEALCLAISSPPGEDATAHFHMRPSPASPNCYQAHRERGANEIRRVVIHNSEATIQRTIATFQTCDPGHPASAHVGIDRDGTMYRFVEDRYAAFHTGGYDGGFNAGSLGVEVMASGRRGSRSMTARQEHALVELIRYWSTRYRIVMPRTILSNSVRSRAYNSVEFWDAPVTIHRLISAGRRTDCPTFIWADSAKGDDAFFKWRNISLR